MNDLGKLIGRKYAQAQSIGTPEDEYAVIILDSGCDTVEEYIKMHPGCKIGLVKIHLDRPFKTNRLLEALPLSVKRIIVLNKIRDSQGSASRCSWTLPARL
jgi:pyruvate-ferredoxin/flavodoxin oxidoreductase